MIKKMDCVKTDCSVRCGKYIYNGDLFRHNGVYILAGVPANKESCNGYADFEIEEFIEIPTSGTFKAYMLGGEITQIDEKFEKILRDYLLF